MNKLPVHCGAVILSLLSVAAIWAGEAVDFHEITVGKDGRFSAGGIRFSVAHFGEGWEYASNNHLDAGEGFPKVGEDAVTFHGRLRLPGKSDSLAISQELRRGDDGNIRARLDAESPEGIPTNTLCVSAFVSIAAGAGKTIRLEGRKGEELLPLPFSYEGKSNLFETSGVTRIVLPSPGGTVELAGDNLRVSLHDDRAFGGSGYSLRIYFAPGSGIIRQSTLEFDLVHFDKAPKPFSSAVIEAGAEWAPYENALEIEAGSVFDQSARAHAPAGKHGRVIVSPSGKFAFANQPDQEVRFWGVNLCFESNFLSHEDADRLADHLAKSGYNAVRIHHYDGLLAPKKGPSFEFDPQRLDQLDYLFAALKKRGLYLSIDLYSFRGFPLSEIPDLGFPIQYPNNGLFKFLVPVSENAFASWKKFAEKLLLRSNPYTGVTWAEDPALISICLINEDTIFHGGIANRKPELVALYNKAYAEWKAELPDGGKKDSPALFNRFLVDLKKKSDAKMMHFLREIGVKSLLTSDNNVNKEAQVYVRNQFDLVDNHEYWNHPIPIGKSVGVNQNSAIGSGLWLPRELMPSRIFGKPYTVTEYNYCWPNAARAEAGVLMPAYAGLQDWSAIFSFDYSARNRDGLFSPHPPSHSGFVFSLVSDPIGLLTDRIGALLFLHGGIRPAETAVCFLTDSEHAVSGAKADPPKLPGEFSWLGLVARIGSLPETAKNMAEIAKATGIRAFVSKSGTPFLDQPRTFALHPQVETELAENNILPTPAGNGVFRSQTGQIEVSTVEGTASLVTDFAECFVLPAGKRLEGKRVAVSNGESFGAVYVVSADGKPLAKSARLVVLHLTDCLPSQTKFSDENRNLLVGFGQLPYLVKRGTAAIVLDLPATGEWRAWAVDASGKRLRPVELKTEDSRLKLEAITATPEGSALAYELSRE